MRSGTCRMLNLAQMFLCHFLYALLCTGAVKFRQIQLEVGTKTTRILGWKF